MKWFGKKKSATVVPTTPSTTATKNAAAPNNPQATNLTLGETINQQGKRCDFIRSFKVRF